MRSYGHGLLALSLASAVGLVSAVGSAAAAAPAAAPAATARSSGSVTASTAGGSATAATAAAGVTRAAADVARLARDADGEVPGLRTAYSRTFATATGSAGGYTTRVFSQPVNYQDAAGAWQKLDAGLTGILGGWAPAQVAARVLLPADLAAPVTLSTPAGVVGFTLVGAHGRATVSGPTAHYAGVLPGVDATETATGSGVKEDLVLAGPSSPSTFTETVGLPAGANLAASDGGAIVRQGGTQLARVLAPSVRDAAGHASTAAASLRVLGSALQLAVDPAWLAAPGRVFPVTLDPVVVGSAGNPSITSTQVKSGAAAGTNYASATSDCVGTDTAAGNAAVRTLLSFGDLGAFIPRDAEVASASIGFNVTSASSPTTVAVYPLTRGFTASGATWNSAASGTAWTTPGGDFQAGERDTPTSVTGADPAYGTHNFYVSAALLQGWLRTGNQPGFLLRADTEGSSGGGLVCLQPAAGSVTPPYMNVSWDVRAGIRGDQKYLAHTISDHEKLSVNVANGNVVDVSREGGPGVFRTWNAGQAGYAWQNGHGWANTPSDTGTYSGGPGGAVDAVNDGSQAISSGTDGSDAFRWYPPSSYAGTTGGSIGDPLGADTTTTTSNYVYTVMHNHSGVVETYSNGSLTTIVDRNGNTTTISRDSSTFSGNGHHYAQTITDPAGRAFTVAHNQGGYLTGVQPPANAPAGVGATSYTYSGGPGWNPTAGAGLLLTATDAAGGITRYGYDSSQRITSITSPAGRVITLAYDNMGRVASTTKVTDPATGAGSTTTYAYTPPTATGANDGTTVVTDPNGHATTYTWNSDDQVTKTTDALGNNRASTYGPDGSVTSATDAMGTGNTGGNTTMTTYSSDGRYNPMSRSAPTGSTDSLGYGPGSYGPNGASSMCAPGNSNPHPYQPDCTKDAQGDTSMSSYDPAGNIMSTKDTSPGGTSTTTSSTHNPPAGQTPTCGGLPGQTCTTTNGLGGVTGNHYDTQGNLTSVTPPAPLAATSASYDSLGRVLTSTDGKGATTRTSYDGLGRATQILTAGATSCSYPAGTCLSSTYDADGNQTSRTDATGTTLYSYDALGRQTGKSLPQVGLAVAAGQTSPQGTYVADTGYSSGTAAYNGNTIDTSAVTNPAPQSVYQNERYGNDFTYTLGGLIPSAGYQVRLHFAETVWNGPGQRVFSVAVNDSTALSNFDIYAAAGAKNKAIVRTAMATATSGGQISLHFTTSTDNAKIDGIEAIPSIASTTGTPALTLGYDPAGNVTSYTDGGGTVTYTYNQVNELVALAEPGGSCVASTNPATYYSTANPPPDSALCTTFAYNPNGARTLTRYPGGTTQTVTVDNSGRATDIKGAHAGTTLTDTGCTYCTGSSACPTTSSARDSEVTQTKTDLTGAVTTYSYDTLGRLTQAAQTVTNPQTWSYGYDPDGNRTSTTGPSTGSHTYGYNLADQLTSRDGSTTGWSYDANGNETAGLATTTRTGETYSPTDQLISLTSNSTASNYAYSGLANNERVTATTGGTPTGYQNGEEGLANQTTGNTTTSWTRDPAGTLISQRTGTTHAYYLTDALGSVLALVDTTGTIGASYTYDPYGITTTSGTPLATSNPWRYTSGYQDPTGLYHLNARYYDPSLGRFTQLDPSGQDPFSYAYVNNDPINGADPSGTGLFSTIAKTVGGAVGTVLAVGVFCTATAGVGCAIAAGVAGGAIFGAAGGILAAPKGQETREGVDGAVSGAIGGAIGGAAGGRAIVRGFSNLRGR